jgi:hypothetical protein
MWRRSKVFMVDQLQWVRSLVSQVASNLAVSRSSGQDSSFELQLAEVQRTWLEEQEGESSSQLGGYL